MPNHPRPLSRRGFVKTLAAQSATLAGAGLFLSPAVRAAGKNPIKWKMVTTWPANFPGLGTGAVRLGQWIEKLSDGRMTVKVYGAGELVPAMGVFDAVSRGTAQMGHGAAYYWKGKSEAAQFFAAVPFGLNAAEMNAWLEYGGGMKLWQELYSSFGLIPFNAGNTGVQMGGWFNKKVQTKKDFKGLKMRMPGLGGEVLSKMGATVVTLPGGELFQAMKTGTIDATEWVGPYNDLAFGFHKAAKYYYWPGWHEPGTTLECMVNQEAYLKLPKDLQQIVKASCEIAGSEMLAEFTARNATALDTLVKAHKVQLMRFSDPVLKTLGKISRDVVAEAGSKDPFAKKVLKSFEDFRRQSVAWGKVSEEAYSLARGLTF